MTTKICSKCREEKPLTPEFWNRRKDSGDGFNNHCKKCRQKSSKQYRLRPEARERARLREYQPNRIAYKDEYERRPEVRAKRASYWYRPEVRERVIVKAQSPEEVALKREWGRSLKGKAYRGKRHANKKAAFYGVEGQLTIADVLALWEKYPVCLRCGKGCGLDHIVPMSQGGPNTPKNIQNLCHRCNSTKKHLSTDYRPQWSKT